MPSLRDEPTVFVNPDPDRVVRVGAITIDVAAVSVCLGEVRQRLPWREFQVLLLLADNAGRVLSADSIRSHVWGDDFVDTTGNLTAHVLRLRRRIASCLDAEYIRTVRGVGYVLEAPRQRPAVNGP